VRIDRKSRHIEREHQNDGSGFGTNSLEVHQPGTGFIDRQIL
jgi:hypothetical protein